MEQDKEKRNQEIIEIDLILTREELIESLKSEWDENNKLREQIHLLETSVKSANSYKEELEKRFDESLKSLEEIASKWMKKSKAQDEEIKRLKVVLKQSWTLWEDLAEAGEISIGFNFSKNYEEIEKTIEGIE